MTARTVTLRAVCEGYAYPTDENGDTEEHPIHAAEWIDPESPSWSSYGWGHPDDPETWTQPEHAEGEPCEVTMSIREAAELIAEWPGGVWDYSEGEYSPDWSNYGAAWSTTVTLFVDGPGRDAAFDLADRLAR